MTHIDILGRIAIDPNINASFRRAVAAVEEEARAAALRYIQMDHRAIKRVARRYLTWPSLIEEVQSGAKHMSLEELIVTLERRLAHRSAFDSASNIMLLGARLYARIVLRRERAEEAIFRNAAQ